MVLYIVKSVFPGMSAESKYFLLQIVLRYAAQPCLLTTTEMYKAFGLSRSGIAQARQELLAERARGGYLEEKVLPGLSRRNPGMLKGAPRKSVGLSQSFRNELNVYAEAHNDRVDDVLFGRVLKWFVGSEGADREGHAGDGKNTRKRGPSAHGKLVLLCLYAAAKHGVLVTNVSTECLARRTGLTVSLVRYQLKRLDNLGYIQERQLEVTSRYVPGQISETMVLNEGRLGRVEGRVVARIDWGPLFRLWNMHMHYEAFPDKDDIRELVQDKFRLYKDGRPWQKSMGGPPSAVFIDLFSGEEKRGALRAFMRIKTCEYTLDLLHGYGDRLVSHEVIEADDVYTRIKEELFSGPELIEDFGKETSEGLASWFYLQVEQMARSVFGIVMSVARDSALPAEEVWRNCCCMLTPLKDLIILSWTRIDRKTQN